MGKGNLAVYTMQCKCNHDIYGWDVVAVVLEADAPLAGGAEHQQVELGQTLLELTIRTNRPLYLFFKKIFYFSHHKIYSFFVSMYPLSTVGAYLSLYLNISI
jgi:hypothetical protein